MNAIVSWWEMVDIRRFGGQFLEKSLGVRQLKNFGSKLEHLSFPWDTPGGDFGAFWVPPGHF